MRKQAFEWQRDIYVIGFSGKRPDVNIDLKRLEKQAREVMNPKAYAYIAGGAGSESTMKSNRAAFDEYAIVPRMLRDVSHRDMSVDLLGSKLSSPLLLSPIGVLDLVYPQAEVAVARAAASMQVPFIFSNQASVAMEVCAAAMGEEQRWFQLYWSKSNELISSFIQRAEQCGCKAIVVTLDTTMLGWRTRDLELGYLPFMEGRGIAQYTSDPVFQQLMNQHQAAPTSRKITASSIGGLIRMVNNYPGHGFLSKLRSGKPLKAVQTFISTYTNPHITWSDLKFLRNQTKLPLLLKGILHPDDAQRAVDAGMNGIIVSNHGGRQVDGAVASLQMLPSIAKVVSNAIPVLVDSGIRGGADVFKALALGAKAVCIGRPYVYGLALRGEEGVRTVLQNLLSEFELTMALAGCKSVAEINQECLMEM
jgi:lactate 2-monooxygenase